MLLVLLVLLVFLFEDTTVNEALNFFLLSFQLFEFILAIASFSISSFALFSINSFFLLTSVKFPDSRLNCVVSVIVLFKEAAFEIYFEEFIILLVFFFIFGLA